jgi:hypothetical protein
MVTIGSQLPYLKGEPSNDNTIFFYANLSMACIKVTVSLLAYCVSAGELVESKTATLEKDVEEDNDIELADVTNPMRVAQEKMIREREKKLKEEMREEIRKERDEAEKREKAMWEQMRDEMNKQQEEMRDEMRKSSVEGNISVMADQPSLSLPTTPTTTSISLEKKKSFTSKTKKSFSRIIGNLMPSSNSISSNTSTSTVVTKGLSSSPHDAFKHSKKASKKYKDDDNSDDLTAAL